MTREIDFSQNYRRELLRAAKGDKRALIERLASGVPATRSDLQMIAVLLTGRLRPKSPRRRGRPRLTLWDMRSSSDPLHVATLKYWADAAALREVGSVYGRMAALNDEVAQAHGVDPEALRASRERHADLNPHKTPPRK